MINGPMNPFSFVLLKIFLIIFCFFIPCFPLQKAFASHACEHTHACTSRHSSTHWSLFKMLTILHRATVRFHKEFGQCLSLALSEPHPTLLTFFLSIHPITDTIFSASPKENIIWNDFEMHALRRGRYKSVEPVAVMAPY